MDQNALQQIIERLKEANNVLVTVSANPSVDQLAACIGLTLLLNHLGKHGTAVFSGEVPSTIEFLKPDDTLEKNTDSLRDFIIALDKSKADKLRYKVEDKVVKIFITPYRTSLSEKDLEFSQGDFNVDAVIALGVHQRAELDKAIMDHGRILHDATIISVNNKDQGNLGAINWVNVSASSLSEMTVELAHGLTKDALDAQMATAFMTGIVAETDRFSNVKTSPRTMALASELMAAGANQQLIASKLEVSAPAAPAEATEAAPENGSLQIEHEEPAASPSQEPSDLPAPKPASEPEPEPEVEEPTPEPPIIPIPTESDKAATSAPAEPSPAPSVEPTPAAGLPSRGSLAMEPPSLGGQLTANSVPEHLQADDSSDPLSSSSLDGANGQPPLLNRTGQTLSPPPAMPPTTEASQPADSQAPVENIDEARQAVDQAIAAEPPKAPTEPIQALGARTVDLDLGNNEPAPAAEPAPIPAEPAMPTTAPAPTLPTVPFNPVPNPPTPVGSSPFGAPPDMNGVNPNLPSNLLPPSQPIDPTAASGNPTPPPPVPPPLPPTDAM